MSAGAESLYLTTNNVLTSAAEYPAEKVGTMRTPGVRARGFGDGGAAVALSALGRTA